ncbi:hypothetical protein BG000_001202 [Podila horticola]|nr:hypothetical protein BG000_001202 [Podila horticola]
MNIDLVQKTGSDSYIAYLNSPHSCGRRPKGGEYQFTVVLSSFDEKRPCASSPEPTAQNKVLATMMKNIGTMDMAITFGINGGVRNVLAQQAALASLIEKLNVVEGSPSDSAVVAGIKSHHVTDYSLETYCCLVRFLYTGEINLNVELDDFAIGSPPNKPFSLSCKERPTLDGLVFTIEPTTSDPNLKAVNEPALARSSSYNELFQLADCYAITKLREFCRDKVIASLGVSNALDVLFSYAYRYNDLKDEVLSVVAKNMDKLYSSDQDPFEPYAHHPQRHVLLTDALRYKLKNLRH